METTFKRSQYYYLWTGNRRFIFLLPSFRASCKMLRSPRLAHKAPQLYRLTCPWLKFLDFLFCFVCLFVCLFVCFSRKFESVGTFKTSGRDGQVKKITSSSHKLNKQIKLRTDFKVDTKINCVLIQSLF